MTVAQLALAWVLARGNDMAPIPGTRRIERLDENLGALNFTLSAADMTEIDRICPVDAVAGARYNERGMATVGL